MQQVKPALPKLSFLVLPATSSSVVFEYFVTSQPRDAPMNRPRPSRHIILPLVFLAVLAICPLGSAQDSNAILEQSIFDKTATGSLHTKNETLINWRSETEFKTIAEAHDTGLKIALPLYDIPVEFGRYSRDNEWSENQAALQTLDLSDTKIPEEFH